MKTLFLIVAALFLLVLGIGAYVRLAPSDPSRWSVDPLAVAKPTDDHHFLLRANQGDVAGVVYDLSPEALLGAFDKVVLSEPRTAVLAGSVADGQIAYITRSKLWGFPDYTSVRAVPDGSGARLAIYARSRFGQSDMGVNRARTGAWLAKLDKSLGGI